MLSMPAAAGANKYLVTRQDIPRLGAVAALAAVAGDRLMTSDFDIEIRQVRAVLDHQARHAPEAVRPTWRRALSAHRPALAPVQRVTASAAKTRARRAGRSRRSPQAARAQRPPAGGSDDGDGGDPDGDVRVIVIEPDGSAWSDWPRVVRAARRLPRVLRRQLLIEVHGRETHVIARGGWRLILIPRPLDRDIDEIEVRVGSKPTASNALDRRRARALRSYRDVDCDDVVHWAASVLVARDPVSLAAYLRRRWTRRQRRLSETSSATPLASRKAA